MIDTTPWSIFERDQLCLAQMLESLSAPTVSKQEAAESYDKSAKDDIRGLKHSSEACSIDDQPTRGAW